MRFGSLRTPARNVPAARHLRHDRQSAYDAAYVTLAQELGGQMWTLDGPLSANAAQLGLPVCLIEAEDGMHA